MLAKSNKTNTQFGQVIEYTLTLEGSDLTADLKDRALVFKDTTSGLQIVRIKQTDEQLFYNIFIEGDWSIDIPLTLADPDQMKNLPVMPATYNNNTYARMDTQFHLYDQGTQYLRVANGSPVKLIYTNGIAFQRESDANPKLLIDTALTTSTQ
jgi:hypothetical protein